MKIFSSLFERFKNQSPSFRVVFVLFLSLLLGIVDYVTTSEFSFSIFYLIPIVLITITGTRKQGIYLSLICALIWLSVDLLSLKTYHHYIAHFWNASVRLGFFLIVVYALSKTKQSYNHLEKEVGEVTLDLLEETLEKEKVELELSKSQELYKNLLENIIEFFYVVNSRDTITYASANFFSMLGLPENKVLGKNLYRFILPEDRRRIFEFVKNPVKEKSSSFQCEFRFITPNNIPLWVEQTSKAIFDLSGNIKEYRNVARDISERKSAEEVLIDSEKNMLKLFNDGDPELERKLDPHNSAVLMNSLAKRISEVNLKMRERVKQSISFASIVTHALKTPLAVMRLELEDVMRTDVSAEELKSLLISTYDEILKLNHIVDDLLNVASLEAGTFPVDKKTMDLQIFLKEFFEEISILFGTKKQEFSFKLGDNVKVEIDPLYFRQVLFTLFDNAIKYTPENGSISLTTQTTDKSVLIILKDNGKGIPKEELNKIFSPFHTIANRKIGEKGSGIGLMMVKKIIDLHDGKITAQSEPYKGATFIISLPIVSIQ